MIRNTAGQVVNCEVITLAGVPFTGAVVVYVTIDTGAQAIGSVAAGAATLKGNGVYQYIPAQAETNGASIEYTFIGAGAAPASKTIVTITPAQNAALQTATGAGVLTGLDLVTDALLAWNIVAAGDPLENGDAVYVLRTLNRILDDWNADRAAVWAENFASFTLTPSLSPHTIGAAGTWVTPQRPQRIVRASLTLPGGSQTPITVHGDAAWYDGLSLPTLTSSIPTDVYYEPDWPTGKLFFYPVPTTAYVVTLLTRVVLARIALVDAFSLPPGYRSAITLTLQEEIAESYEKTVTPRLEKAARLARARIFTANRITPRIVTRDAGLAGGGGASGGTYLNGWQGD
jgi:hypothetical protein